MAGIYHNAELGVISMSSDGTNWLTIADKNLGATQVYNDGDTLSEANSGKLYQWGNNYGFPRGTNIAVTSSSIYANSYGPSNYYSSSTYRAVANGNFYYWDASDNSNLWGATTGTYEAMKGPCPTGFHIPSKDDADNLGNIITTLGVLSRNMALLKMPSTGYIKNGIYTTESYFSVRTTTNWNSYTSLSMWGSTTAFSTGVEGRANACPIRPFKNEPVVPDYTWERLYGDELPSPKNYIKRFQNNGNYYYFGDAPTHASGVTLNKSSILLTEVGQTEQLVATVAPEDAVDKGVTWISSDTTVAIVARDGTVTCISPGDCTITATTIDGGLTATCSVSYTKVTGVTLNKSIINLTGAGQTEQLIATVAPSTAVYKEVTWSSSDTSIATVDNTGLVTCISPGNCTITVTTTEGGYTATCNVIKYMYVNYLVVGGGGGGATNQYGGGGGGGAICIGNACFGINQIDVVIGTGGGANTNGGNSYICNSDFNINAKGGCKGSGTSGGNSGSGCSGKKCSSGVADAGGGGGACGAASSQVGGLGYNGMGGGGGGGWSTSQGYGVCGGGDGGPFSSSGIRGCNATGYGGGGGGGGYYSNTGGVGGNGCQGVVDICYLANGSCGFTSATGGNSCYTCNGYCVHRFTSNGTFCIVG